MVANGFALQIEDNNCPSAKTTKALEAYLEVMRNNAIKSIRGKVKLMRPQA